MKYSDLLGQWLVELGYTHCFFVAGGGIMHLLDGFRNRFECIPVVHEMSAGICTEHFNQCRNSNQRAFALVTTGPGLTNIVTAIAGCYVEHRELLVISGQVKSTDLLKYPERQHGVQEIDGSGICNPITIRSIRLDKTISRSEFIDLVRLSQGPHPGPVLIEVCLDIQGKIVNKNLLCEDQDITTLLQILPQNDDIALVRKIIRAARRPLILLGGLVSRHVAWESLPAFENLGIPVATTTNAIDRIPTISKIFAGRPGTWGGQRAANLILAQADVVLVLGAQLDLQQTGFNYQEFAPQAQLIHVFPSRAELERTGPPAYKKIFASPDPMITELLPLVEWKDHDAWLDYVQQVRKFVPSIEPGNINSAGFINSFHFLRNLSRATKASDVLALCSSGGTFTGSLQTYEVAPRQLTTTSPAHASMGYGLATAIGAAFANRTRRVILTEGEGGFCQNLQELALLKRFSLPIKIFLIENKGYASIRSTQKKFFKGEYLGCDYATGLDFPDWIKLFDSYGIPCRFLHEDDAQESVLRTMLDEKAGPEAWIVPVDPDQPNWPALLTTLAADGFLQSSPLYDMLPKLSDEMMSYVGRYLPVADKVST